MFFEKAFYGNTVKEWLVAATVFVVAFVIMRILKAIIYRQVFRIANKTDNVWDNVAAELINKTKPVFLFTIALYLGSLSLSLPESVTIIIGKFVGVVILIQLAILGTYIISFWVNREREDTIRWSCRYHLNCRGFCRSYNSLVDYNTDSFGQSGS